MLTMHHPRNSTNHIANFSSRHEGGSHFLLGDGAVRFLSENLNYDTLTPSGIWEPTMTERCRENSRGYHIEPVASQSIRTEASD
ncbi:H-X9-DG-CTERM domain-containing protein [Gimesia sp.]|uniref:H-X9-DG-CTERM domain-containing protein n=1 Tax=Gimesia sp. TaxID=2024833 RepID=UPI003A8CBF21